jgi:hypothetical protein
MTTPNELRMIIQEYSHLLNMFSDCEPTEETEDELADRLDIILNGPGWRKHNMRFIPVADDGTGGQFAVWVKPDSNPVVFFGSEGEYGMVAASPIAFIEWLSHCPGYESDENDAITWTSHGGFIEHIDEEPDKGQALRAQSEMQASIELGGGGIKSLEEIINEVSDLQDEFFSWIRRQQLPNETNVD